MLKNIFYVFLLWAVGLSAQENGNPEYSEEQKSFNNIENSSEQELISHIEHSSSKERILALCLYQEKNNQNNLTLQQIDELFEKLESITVKDKEFRAFLDFYKRIKPMFLSEKQFDIDRRLDLFQKTLKYYQETKNDLFAGICHMYIAYDLYFLNLYEPTIENLLKADELFNKVGYSNIPMIGRYLHDMALIFIFFGDFEKTAELMEKDIKLPAFDDNRDVQRHNNLGVAYQNLKQYDKAEKAFLKALERAEFWDTYIWRAIISRNLADVYVLQGKYPKAVLTYENSLPYYDKEEGNWRERIKHLLSMAKAQLLIGNTSRAEEYIIEAEHIVIPAKKILYFGERQQDEKYKQFYYEVKQAYHKVTNNYKKAYLYSDSLNTINRSRDSIYNILRVHLAKEKLNVQKTLSEKKRIHTKMWTIGIGSLSVVIILALLYYINRIKRAKEKAEHLYKEKILEEDRQRLNSQLKVLKADLENHLKKITENNRLVEQYKNETEKDDKIDIDNLKILTKEHWENFIRDFKKAHKRFYNKVTKQYPDLTQSELRMILLLKLGITQKELPSVLGTSDVNIRVTLHRLRQKITRNVTETEDKEILVLTNTL